MTKEKLLARKLEAEQQKTQMIAQINLIQGMIAECDYWLTQVEEQPEVEPKTKIRALHD